MKIRSWLLRVVLASSAFSAYGAVINIPLGTADSFAVLAGAKVTNTGLSVVDGNLGVAPGTALTGFGPENILPPGAYYSAGAVALQAQTDLTTAYNLAASQSCSPSGNLTGQDLGGLTLTPGVYCFDSSAQLTGTLTLNALGDSSAVFLFQIASTLTTASDSSVVFTNLGQGGSVYYQVGSSATLGTGTQFAGNILALSDITLTTGASIDCGRALARNGSVTMDTNSVLINTAGCESTNGSDSPVPEPGSASLLGLGLLAWPVISRLRSTRQSS
jgi:hypothetical protein